MFISMLATLLPLAVLGAWIWPVLAARWRQAHRPARLGLGVFWLVCAGFLLGCPHEDVLTGLDDMAYRQMAHVFLDGRGFHDPDTVLAGVPPDLRINFLSHRGTGVRPTRDRVFQLSDRQGVETRPFFMPMLPLAAAGLSPVLAPERGVPLVAALALALVLAAGFCAGGGWGVVAVAALCLGTAWPAWFLRGFYSEGVGAMLAAAVVAASAVRPLRGGLLALAGFALGLAVTYHPTLLILSGTVALGLMLERNSWKSAAGVAAGLLAGLFPFWAFTRWVCQPYGDWTRLDVLRRMMFSQPEHRAIALVLGMLAVVSMLALCAGFRPAVRAWAGRLDRRMIPRGWLAAYGLPLVLIAVLPGFAGEALRKGAAAAWSGIRWPYGALFLAGAWAVVRKERPIRERFWLAALCASGLLALFIQGVEVPVGLWSQRRFLPVVLPGIALLAAPLSAGLSAGAARGRWRSWSLVLGMALAGLWNLIQWPAAFVTVNDRGATEWTQAVAARIGTDRRVVFDYYPHAVPYASGLEHQILGLGKYSLGYWPEVARWLAEVAQHEEIWLATSWSPCTLEEGARLEAVFATTGRFSRVRTKAFFPAQPDEITVRNSFLRWVPLAEGAAAPQEKVLDGSPVGLRGPWGEIRREATWTRQGSGLIGPVPEKGGTVVFAADCTWSPPEKDWTRQDLLVTPPWGGEPLELAVPAGDQHIRGILARPAGDADRPATGTYSFHVERPYDPARFGLRGYSSDLGVLMRRISIR